MSRASTLPLRDEDTATPNSKRVARNARRNQSWRPSVDFPARDCWERSWWMRREPSSDRASSSQDGHPGGIRLVLLPSTSPTKCRDRGRRHLREEPQRTGGPIRLGGAGVRLPHREDPAEGPIVGRALARESAPHDCAAERPEPRLGPLVPPATRARMVRVGNSGGGG